MQMRKIPSRTTPARQSSWPPLLFLLLQTTPKLGERSVECKARFWMSTATTCCQRKRVSTKVTRLGNAKLRQSQATVHPKSSYREARTWLPDRKHGSATVVGHVPLENVARLLDTQTAVSTGFGRHRQKVQHSYESR